MQQIICGVSTVLLGYVLGMEAKVESLLSRRTKSNGRMIETGDDGMQRTGTRPRLQGQSIGTMAHPN